MRRSRSARADRGRDDTTNISRLPYTPGLDGMRALAVVAVMVYHANKEWLAGGFLGVEVFFVISGYLITLLLISEHERSDRVNLGQFWLRRARRLLPALFLMLGMVVTYTAFFKSEALGQLRGDVLAGVFYVSNWFQIWVGDGYTDFAEFAPLRHLWSLAVEEQFYLVWPVVMALLLRRQGRRITDTARWLVLASLVITVVMALLYHGGPVQTCEISPDAYWQLGDRCFSKGDTLYLNTITRSGGLLLGAAFAMVWRPFAIMRGPLQHKGPLLDLVAVVGILGLAALNWYLHFMTPASGADPWLFRGGFLLTGITSLMVIAAATHARANTGRLLGNPVFLWVGKRSYGLYLYHWPIYQVIREQAGIQLKFGEFAVAMIVTVAITEVSYRYVEMPIRRGMAGEWWRRMRSQRDPVPRRIVAAAGAVGVAAASFATVNLATAKVEPNEIESALDQQEAHTVDGGAAPTTSASDGAGAPPPAGNATSTTTPANEPSPTTAAPTTTTAPAQPPASGGNPPPKATTTTSAPTTAPPANPTGLYALGDSVMLGAAEQLTAYGFQVQAAESRSFDDGMAALRRDMGNGLVGDVVVVNLGANDSTMDEDDMDAMMNVLEDVPTVVWVTVRLDYPHIYPLNAAIRELPNEYPGQVKVLDWAEVGNRCSGACFYDDNLHLDVDGRQFYADHIAKAAGVA